MLIQLGKSPKSLDEISARTGIRKDRVAKVLWHLLSRGWVVTGEEVRRLPVYRRVRDLPVPRPKAQLRREPAEHIAALNAAFGIRLPTGRLKARTVRRGGSA